MDFILASSSPRRRQIISEMIADFDIIKPEIDESQQDGESPLAYVQRLSRQKAQAVAEHIQYPAVILAADTIVVLADDENALTHGGEILGKPASPEEAHTTLQRLRNRPHFVCTAFTVHRGIYQHTEVVITTVHMRDYSDAEIDAYIATGDPFDKAGSYAIQHEEFHPVCKIEGSYTNVVGLPADEVKRALLLAGLKVEGCPFQIKNTPYQIVEFIAGDDPLAIDLDPRFELTFSMCMVRQGDKYLWLYNPEEDRQQWELSAGCIEAGEHPTETAHRELFEETGQRAESLQHVGLMKIHYENGHHEYGALYVGTLPAGDLLPFTPNPESEKLLLWDFTAPMQEPVSQVSYAAFRYIQDSPS